MSKTRWLPLLVLAALLSPVASQAVPIRLTAGLVGEWHLQTIYWPGLELAPDTSGYNQTGRVIGPKASSYGWMYSGVNLTGDQYITVNNSPNLNFGTGSFTLAAWIRITDTNRGIKTIIENRGTDGRGYSFAVYGGNQLLLQMADETGWLNFHAEDTWSLVPNRWHHVAVSVNRTGWPVNVTFYIDGFRAGFATPKMGNINNTNLPFMIGGHKDWSGARFGDRIDEVLVYNRALPMWDVWSIMNPGRPNYNPSFWNNNSNRKRKNNCYNYTNNKATDTFAQPGRASGAQSPAMSCFWVHRAAEADGLVPVPDYPNTLLDFQSGAALVVAPGRDYHWYRLAEDGTWSHKPGQTSATNRDNSGNIITDPRTANRGIYSDFCGFFMLWSDIAEGYGHENIN
ncbi:MAG TPA: LamG domain-containing protein [Thermoanaerobaculia bacterium]|nr:LamG domain-containing protein [Thermoanaerobaculia bacterium]